MQWGSRKQKVVALSSTKAEYKAISQASTQIAWLKSLLAEIKVSSFSIPVVWCDNLSNGVLASNVVLHS